MSNNTPAASAATPTLTTIDGKVTTNSMNIAEVFEKEHKHVMRDIKSLEVPVDFAESNFGLCQYQGKNGQSYDRYTVTRDGFTLLAMGYTGKAAMKFKLGYITAFNLMETELLKKPARPAISSTALSPAQQRSVQEAVGATGQWRTVYGAIKTHFRVGTYRDLPASRFDEVINFIHALNLKPVNAQPAISPVETVTISCQKLKALFNLIAIYRESYDTIHMLEATITTSAEAVTRYRYRTHDAVTEAANIARNIALELKTDNQL